jgi:rhodanese-related sulfurtransferase
MEFKSSAFLIILIGSIGAFWAFSRWKASIQIKEQRDFVVINVLDKSLYDDCHIKGSIHVPFNEIDYYASLLDKSIEVVVYCSNYMCASSNYAAKKLRELGFTKVLVYEGGMAEWYQKGLPVEGPGTQIYLKNKVNKVPDELKSDIAVITAESLAQKLGVSAALAA